MPATENAKSSAFVGDGSALSDGSARRLDRRQRPEDMIAKKPKACPRCGESLSTSKDSSGVQLRCEACGASFRIAAKSRDDAGGSSASSSAKEASDQPNSAERLGRFELKRLLGEGGFGKVFLAFDPRLERDVAVKVPTFSSKDRRRIARFRSEARTAAILRHPNIVQTLESGEADDTLYIVSQYIEGAPLTDHLADGALDFKQISIWVESIARALAYAHQNGIVHRDIKPDNVLIDGSGEPQIMDFGLAKQEGRKGVTQDDAIVGTLHYMSPEQARGEDDAVTATSDQYSLGAIFYEMLCGSKPFDGASHVILTQVADPQTEPESPRKRRSAVPKDLEVICLKAIAKQTSDRYENCEELAEDLRRWRNDLPITARRSTIAERTYRFCRRNPVVSSLTAALAVAFAVSIGFHLDNLRKKRKIGSLTTQKQVLENDIKLADGRFQKLNATNTELEGKNQTLSDQTEEATRERIAAENATKKAVEAQGNAERDKKKATDDLAIVQVSLNRETAKLEQAKVRLAYTGYQSKLQLASQNIRSQNYPRAQLELAGCAKELRDWEWRYLVSKSSPRLWEKRFGEKVLGMLSLEQLQAIALLTKSGIQIVSAIDGKSLKELPLDQSSFTIAQPLFAAAPPSVRWNPLKSDPANKFLALTTKGDDGYRVKIWELATGDTPYGGSNQDVVFTDNPGMVAVDATGQIAGYNTNTWAQVAVDGLAEMAGHFSLPHNERSMVLFLPTGKVRLGNKFCKKRNLSQGAMRELGDTSHIALSADRNTVLTIVQDKEIEKLVTISNKRDSTTTKHDAEIHVGALRTDAGYCLSHDGARVAAILSGKAHVFDSETGDRLGVMGASENIAFLKIGQDDDARNALLAVNGEQAEVFNLTPEKELVFAGRNRFVSVAFAPQAGYLTAVDDEGFLFVYARKMDGNFVRQTRGQKDAKSNNLTEVAFLADGQRLITHGKATAYFDGLNEDTEVQSIPLTRENAHYRTPVTKLRLSPDEERFVTVDRIGKVFAWKVEASATIPTAFPESEVDFRPEGDVVWLDNRHVVCTTARRKTSDESSRECPIWNVETGAIESWVKLDGRVLATNPERSRLAAGTRQGGVDLYRIERDNGEVRIVKQIGSVGPLFNGPVTAIGFHLKGKRLFVAADEQLKVLEPMTSAELISVDSPVGNITDFTFSGDGEAIAVCGTGGGIWILEANVDIAINAR
ncbi:MAG: WD40 repeat domain-containing serine/threonine protein kinase [Planctomycetota bacterium]